MIQPRQAAEDAAYFINNTLAALHEANAGGQVVDDTEEMAERIEEWVKDQYGMDHGFEGDPGDDGTEASYAENAMFFAVDTINALQDAAAPTDLIDEAERLHSEISRWANKCFDSRLSP